MSHVVSFDATVLTLEAWGPSDAPLVVLVHGLGLSTRSWGRVPERLAERYHVVGYDLRGHGRSGNAPAGDYTLATHARDLDAVLDAVVPEGRKAVLVGNSLGGGIILALARDHGCDRVAGAVFAGSGGSGVTVPGFPAHHRGVVARKALRQLYLWAMRVVALVGHRIRPVERLANRLVRLFAFEQGAPQEAVDMVREDFLGTRRQALARTTLASVSEDGSNFASALTVPTLVLHGTEDPEVTQEDIDKLMPALPDGELVQLPGAGHMLALTREDVVVDAVARWVERTQTS